MIVLRRSPMKRPVPPPSLARVRQWEGPTPTPRAPARAVLAPLRVVVSLPKENALQHSGYMALVRKLPCSHCFTITVRREFAHADLGKGKSIKTDCRRGYPACPACHYLIGSTGKLGKAERRRIEELYGQLTRERILAAGTWPKRLPRWPT